MRALGLRSTLGRDQTCVTDCVRPVCVSALLCRLHSKRQFGLNACGVCDRDEPQGARTAHYTHHTQSPARWRSRPAPTVWRYVELCLAQAEAHSSIYI